MIVEGYYGDRYQKNKSAEQLIEEYTAKTTTIINALNVQVGGDHYKKYKIQPAEFSHANKLDWFQGNIVKYITRFRDKDGLKDLEKVKHMVDLLIELEYKENK